MEFDDTHDMTHFSSEINNEESDSNSLWLS